MNNSLLRNPVTLIILAIFAILLIGGDKTGNNRGYEVHVPVAYKLYDEHIETLKKEGRIDGQ